MTTTFSNDNDIILYTLERIIAYSRDNQYIFLAQKIWWISSIISLQQRLIVHIDNLKIKSETRIEEDSSGSKGQDHKLPSVQPSRINQISDNQAVSTTPVDLTEDSIIDQLIEWAEQFIESSEWSQNTWQRNCVNP